MILIAYLLFIWKYGFFIWYAPPVSARLVDEQGAPVASAIVDVSWSVTAPFTGASVGRTEVRESVSDQQGVFNVRGWGPRFVWRGAIHDDQPTVSIFKQGFKPLVLRNTIGLSRTSAPFMIRFRLQDANIPLQRMRGTLLENQNAFFAINESIAFSYLKGGADECAWTEIPLLLGELGKIKRALDTVESIHALSHFPDLSKRNPAGCDASKNKGLSGEQ